jgi:hypothetical protein
MDELAKLDTPEQVQAALAALPKVYRDWLKLQTARELDGPRRDEIRSHLLQEAETACQRIEDGIRLLAENAELRTAFCLANRAMAMAARKRSPDAYTTSIAAMAPG